MTFSDKALVQLAEAASRQSMFDAVALEQFLGAAYDTSRMALKGPFDAVFEQFDLGLAIPRTGTVEGHWGVLGASERQGANLNISGLGGPPVVVDAFWRGHIVARVSAPTGRITVVKTDWPDPSAIDREIVQALGELPGDPAVRQQERRARLSARLKTAVADPDVVTDAVIDRVTKTAGAIDLNELFERYSRSVAFGPVQITVSEGPPQPAAPKALPISAAILVRSEGTGLAQMLADSRALREQMELAGLGRAEESGLPMLRSLLVIWVLPDTVFDDADWPGDNPAARRAAAGAWLAKEGIGLALVA